VLLKGRRHLRVSCGARMSS